MPRPALLSPATIVSRNPDLLTSNLEGDTVMMSIASGNYYGLNPVGSRIWELLAKPMSVRALCDVLMAEFEVDEATCLRQVSDFVGQLAEEQLASVTTAT